MEISYRRAAAIVAYLIFIIVVPVALTLSSVTTPATLTQNSDNPTPFGYTISLSLFLFPMAALLFWVWRFNKITFQKTAFLYSIAVLAPTGIVLDVLFGNTFFTFENHHAVLGIYFPAVGGPLPIEELIFYVSGFVTVLLLYVWCDEYWLEKYNVPDYTIEAQNIDKVLQFHGQSVIIGLGLVLLAIIYKKFLSQNAEGFPWYFTYITIVALIPSMAFYKSTRRFINWRALSFTFFTMVLISIIWETTLALPYQWWGFQEHAMTGFFIGAWHNLPIEEIVVWFSVSYASIIIYETFKIWLASKRVLKQ
ncbi:lycopene cyclase domain-containing protein [Kaarinaea lacus]